MSTADNSGGVTVRWAWLAGRRCWPCRSWSWSVPAPGAYTDPDGCPRTGKAVVGRSATYYVRRRNGGDRRGAPSPLVAGYLLSRSGRMQQLKPSSGQGCTGWRIA